MSAMMHVIWAGNRHEYEAVIETHFFLRHTIFVDERGWKTLARPDLREIDAYDNDDSVYLLAIDGAQIVGGIRLYPTLKPTMMSEVFPHLADVRGVPRDAEVWEWSRLFVVKERRDTRLMYDIMAAVQQLCLEEGITHVSGVMETWWLPNFQEMGFVVQPLGLPGLVENAWTMAAKIVISWDSLQSVKSMTSDRNIRLVRRGPRDSFVHRAIAEHRATASQAA